MSPTLTGNAARSTDASQSQEIDVTRRAYREKAKAKGTTADGFVTPTKVEGLKKIDKQSLDYVWRTGLAGGLAGCAVGYLIDVLSSKQRPDS